MKWNKKYFNNTARALLVLALLVSVIGFSERNPEGEVCREVVITIDNHAENYYLDENDILNLMTGNGLERIAGATFAELNLKEMEAKVQDEPFVDNVEIFRDLKANLHVKVSLKRPMARIIRNNGPHAYLAEDGTVMPVSAAFSSRVLLISGDIPDNLKGEEPQSVAIKELVNTIYKDDFWRGQIAQMHVQPDGEILMYPQVTSQTIEFGLPENAEEKFRKLKIFYKKILPSAGWNAYSRVNVAFKDQIIAE